MSDAATNNAGPQSGAQDAAVAELTKLVSQLSDQLAKNNQTILVLQNTVNDLVVEVDALGTEISALMTDENPLENIDSDGSIAVRRTGEGIRLSQNHFMRLFDLYYHAVATVKVRGHAYAFFNAGQFSNIAAGTATIDTNITITESVYIYVKFDRGAGTITLEKGTTVPAGTDEVEYYPLWYIPWLGTGAQIDYQNIIDLRDALHMEAMS